VRRPAVAEGTDAVSGVNRRRLLPWALARGTGWGRG